MKRVDAINDVVEKLTAEIQALSEEDDPCFEGISMISDACVLLQESREHINNRDDFEDPDEE